jgi:cytochrome c-type biogenesis protein
VTVSASVAYAFTLGLIAAVNPCGFPLLPGYLALFARSNTRSGRGPRTIAALLAGGCVTLGFIAVFATVGLLASATAQWVIGEAPWFMIVFGAVLAVLGVSGLFGKHFRIGLPTIRFRSGNGAIAMAGFGCAYAVGSLTCALPLFIAGVAGTFTRLGLFAGIATFVAYALGMGTFVTGLSLITINISGFRSRRLRWASRLVPVLGNSLEIIVGLYLVFYWVADLMDPLSRTAATSTVGAIQGAISGVLSDSPLMIGCALGATVVAGFAIAAWSTRRRTTPDRVEKGSDGH